MLQSTSSWLKAPTPQTLPIEAQMRALTEEFSEHLAVKEKINVLPHREIAWEKFRSLPFEKQCEKLESLQNFYRSCAIAADEGISLRDGVGLVKKVLKRLDFRFCDGLFEEMDGDDIIEVYSKDFTQIFRNLRMLELCSYSIVDLYSFEWPELFRRPYTITQKLIDTLQVVMNTLPPKTVYCDLPDHLLEETFSPDKNKLLIDQKILSPLMTQDGAIVGFIGTLSAHLFKKNDINGICIDNVTPLSL